MMAHKVEKHLALFRLLIDTTEAQRLAIVKTLQPSQTKALLEAKYNVLRGTCPVSDKVKKKLYQQRGIIRQLVSKELSSKQQHRLLVKHREILPLLLKPVVNYLTKKE